MQRRKRIWLGSKKRIGGRGRGNASEGIIFDPDRKASGRKESEKHALAKGSYLNVQQEEDHVSGVDHDTGCLM